MILPINQSIARQWMARLDSGIAEHRLNGQSQRTQTTSVGRISQAGVALCRRRSDQARAAGW